MSKVFFDKYVSLAKLERYIRKVTNSNDEKQELWRIVDEMVHHRVLHCVLNELKPEYHEEFLVKLESGPHDESLLDYLTQKIKKDISTFIRLEIKSLENEVLKEIKGMKRNGQ